MNEERTIKKLLLIGLAGGILTMIGDFLLMGADAAGAGSMKNERRRQSKWNFIPLVT